MEMPSQTARAPLTAGGGRAHGAGAMKRPAAAVTALICTLAAATAAAPNPFFVFDNGLRGDGLQSLEAKLDLVKHVGFDGLSWRTDDPQTVKQLLEGARARGLAVPVLYANLELRDGTMVYDPRLKEIIGLCKGAGTMLWPNITSRQFKCSDPAGDEIAVAGLRELADLCEANGLRIAIYPHVDMWVHRLEDALRVARKVDRRNVGVTFNLCHALLDGAEERIPALIKEAGPQLFVATVNGADRGVAKGEMNRAIMTLDRGSYDVGVVLRALRQAGFRGPIGLQCYNLAGDPRDTLPGSMAAWRKLSGTP